MSIMHHELFVCDCGDIQHQFVISYFDDDVLEKCLYVSVNLYRQSFFRRLWIGIQYIFGKQSVYGAFDEVILNEEDSVRLRNILNERIAFWKAAG